MVEKHWRGTKILPLNEGSAKNIIMKIEQVRVKYASAENSEYERMWKSNFKINDTADLTVFFAHSGSACVKAVRRTLMKSTPESHSDCSTP